MSGKVHYCFKMNTKNKTITQVASIRIARIAFGIACVKQYIYAVGGTGSESGLERDDENLVSCERYDIINNIWSDFVNISRALIAPTCITVDNRYIYAFGGDDFIETMNHAYFQRIDTESSTPYWEIITLPHQPGLLSIFQIGAMVSPCSTPERHQIILFGGGENRSPYELQTSVWELDVQIKSGICTLSKREDLAL